MGERIEKLKRFAKALGNTVSNIGKSAGNVMKNMEKADHDINEKMKKITANADKF